MTIKSQKGLPLTATLQPEDFPVGSPRSRAAVRMQLVRILGTQFRFVPIVGNRSGKVTSCRIASATLGIALKFTTRSQRCSSGRDGVE
jgi:hypothetical protein